MLFAKLALLERDETIAALKKLIAELEERVRELEKPDEEIIETAMDLAGLREAMGVTQVQLAKALGITQSEVSGIEKREDHKLSTLRRYVEALGGKLEIVAVINGNRVRLR